MRQTAKSEIESTLRTALGRGTSVVLATVSDTGEPSTAFCSWVVSGGPQTIALALDSRSRAFRNITDGRTQVALEVMADELIVSVRGRAAVAKEQLRSVPFPCALIVHRGEVERAIFEELQETALGRDQS